MNSYLRQKYERGRYILQKEGLFAFFGEGVRFLRRCVFIYEGYYTYELPLDEPIRFASAPKIQNSVFEIVATSQRLKELAAQDFDFGVHSIGALEKLDAGALMFCIFIGKELACIHWAATTREAMDALIGMPYKVDFLSNQAYLGWSETNPKYRRLLLSRYNYSEERRLLANMGKTMGLTLAEKSNQASLKGLPKAGGRVYGEGRYLKILWWKSWKEKPVVSEADQPRLVERNGSQMMSSLVAMLKRAKDILQTEGLKPLLTRGFAFLAARFFDWGECYLYEYTLNERNEADYLPGIQDFTLKIVSSNKDADELAVAIGFDFRRRFVRARSMLDTGAIAFCIFVRGEIAHIGWVALSEKAHRAVDNLPYKVDFSNHEACTGGTLTVLEYRSKGLMAYGYFKRFEFLREKGILVSRNAVDKSNIASQRAHAKFGPRIYAEARYRKLLWWRFWKEKPLAQPVSHN